jgi:hypothetical protein
MTATILGVLLPSGGGRQPAGLPSPDSVPTGGRLIASDGVSVSLPAGWVGRTAVLPQGARTPGLAWLQATNFPIGRLVHGEDPLKAMSAGQVAVTITDRTPEITHIPLRSGSPLTMSAAIPVPQAETPRGHLELELAPTIDSRPMIIDIDFGSRGAVRRLAPSVNRLLQTLRVIAPPHGTAT